MRNWLWVAVLVAAESLAAVNLELHPQLVFERVRRPQQSVLVGGSVGHTQRDHVPAADHLCR